MKNSLVLLLLLGQTKLPGDVSTLLEKVIRVIKDFTDSVYFSVAKVLMDKK